MGSIAYRQAKTSDQKAAIADLRHDTDQFEQDLLAKSHAIREQTGTPTIPPFRVISPGIAVIQYASELPMGWGIAIGLDWLIYLLLIASVICWLDLRTPYRPPASFGVAHEELHDAPPDLHRMTAGADAARGTGKLTGNGEWKQSDSPTDGGNPSISP